MGKKYIIELNDECNSEFKGIMAFGLTQEKQISVELIPEESMTPYTEPDMGQIRKEAYEDGYENGFVAGHLKAEKSGQSFYEDGYQRCLNDTWEAIRKVNDMTLEEQGKVFKTVTIRDVIRKYSASEVIEKIRQYEQKQEKKDGVWIASETWIVSEANEPSVDTTLICSKCGYAVKIKPHETPALNFCPKCGDCKKPKEEES